jgi:hypothetical protein
MDGCVLGAAAAAFVYVWMYGDGVRRRQPTAGCGKTNPFQSNPIRPPIHPKEPTHLIDDGQGLPRRHPQLPLHQVHARHHLRHRVLHLWLSEYVGERVGRGGGVCVFVWWWWWWWWWVRAVGSCMCERTSSCVCAHVCVCVSPLVSTPLLPCPPLTPNTNPPHPLIPLLLTCSRVFISQK